MNFNITAQQARHLSSVPKADGIRLLAKQLNFNNVDFEEDLRSASLVDYYYNILRFAAEKGMAWSEVSCCLSFANSYFPHLIEGSLSEAIRTLHSLSAEYVSSVRIQLASAKKLVGYFMTVILPHHKLYQLVFQSDREDKTFNVDLTVEAPVNELSLKDAQPLAHWDYYRRLHRAEYEEQVKNQQLSLKEKLVCDSVRQAEKEIDRKIQEKEYYQDELEVNTAEDFLSSLTSDKIELMKKSIELEVEKMNVVAQNALAIKGIPVPKDLEVNFPPLQNQSKSPGSKSPRSAKSSRPVSTASSRKKR